MPPGSGDVRPRTLRTLPDGARRATARIVGGPGLAPKLLFPARMMHVSTEPPAEHCDGLAPFAEARQLARLVRDLALAARRDSHRHELGGLASLARAALVAVTEALHASDPHAELRGLRDAQVLLGELRARAYPAFLGRALDGARFDALVIDAARTGRELDRAIQSARRRARRRIDEA